MTHEQDDRLSFGLLWDCIGTSPGSGNEQDDRPGPMSRMTGQMSRVSGQSVSDVRCQIWGFGSGTGKDDRTNEQDVRSGLRI